MHSNTRLKLRDVNPNLLCVLCGGYIIDATTIIECIHSFCKTCIYKYLESSKYCPICDVQVHKTKPLLNVRSDKTLQTLVYKLVPSLFKEEMRRRREFYAAHPNEGVMPEGSLNASEIRGEVEGVDDVATKVVDENISICLQQCITLPPYKNEHFSANNNPETKAIACRYLLCPSSVTVGHLKKLIRLKCDIPETYRLDLFYSDEGLRDTYTILDIASVYAWRRVEPLKLFYIIHDNTLTGLQLSPPSVKSLKRRRNGCQAATKRDLSLIMDTTENEAQEALDDHHESDDAGSINTSSSSENIVAETDSSKVDSTLVNDVDNGIMVEPENNKESLNRSGDADVHEIHLTNVAENSNTLIDTGIDIEVVTNIAGEDSDSTILISDDEVSPTEITVTHDKKVDVTTDINENDKCAISVSHAEVEQDLDDSGFEGTKNDENDSSNNATPEIVPSVDVTPEISPPVKVTTEMIPPVNGVESIKEGPTAVEKPSPAEIMEAKLKSLPEIQPVSTRAGTTNNKNQTRKVSHRKRDPTKSVDFIGSHIFQPSVTSGKYVHSNNGLHHGSWILPEAGNRAQFVPNSFPAASDMSGQRSMPFVLLGAPNALYPLHHNNVQNGFPLMPFTTTNCLQPSLAPLQYQNMHQPFVSRNMNNRIMVNPMSTAANGSPTVAQFSAGQNGHLRNNYSKRDLVTPVVIPGASTCQVKESATSSPKCADEVAVSVATTELQPVSVNQTETSPDETPAESADKGEDIGTAAIVNESAGVKRPHSADDIPGQPASKHSKENVSSLQKLYELSRTFSNGDDKLSELAGDDDKSKTLPAEDATNTHVTSNA